jgi:hypothetical protein
MSALPPSTVSPFEQEVDLRSFSAAVVNAPDGTAWHQSATFALHAQVNSIVERIERPFQRTIMLRIFTDLARMIEYLRIIDYESGNYVPSEEALSVLNQINEEADRLVVFLNTRALAIVDTEQLFEVFDGAVFAIEHELRRVFKEELDGLHFENDENLVRGKLTHSRGLLNNCFQQSFITLAQVFNPFIDGSTLFNDLQVRQQQSIILYHDLLRLITLSRGAESNCSIEWTMILLEKLEQFRGSSMHYLMYRDWQDYEREVSVIMEARTIEERAQVLGRFACYLETLLSHVRMRVCLTNVELPELPGMVRSAAKTG